MINFNMKINILRKFIFEMYKNVNEINFISESKRLAEQNAKSKCKAIVHYTTS